MARLGSKVSQSVVILSSDEEEDSNQGRPVNSAESGGQTNQYRGIPPEFMRVIKKLREHLREEKDDRRCNILGLMYRKASKTLTTCENFKNFIKDIMVELEKAKNDRASILLLLTALCQTLAVGEIMWSPVKSENRNKSKTKTNARPSSSKGALQKETREQCNAVKALLFNDSPPPRPPDSSSSLNNKSKDRENNDVRSRVAVETKEKEKVEKKTGKKQNANNKTKSKNASDVAEGKTTEKGEKKSTKSSRRSSSTITSKKKDDSRSSSGSPPIIIDAPKDPYLTDLSSEATSSMVPCNIDIISTKDQMVADDPSPEESSNVIELGDFDIDLIDTEEVEDAMSCDENGVSSPDLQKSSSASDERNGLSILEVDVASPSDKSLNNSNTPKLLSTKSKVAPLSKDSNKPTETQKSSLLLSTKSTQLVKDNNKPTNATKTKKSEKSRTLKKRNEQTSKHREENEKSSPSASPILSPTSRRSTFLKAVEKVKKDVSVAEKKPEEEFVEKCATTSTEKKDPPVAVQDSSANPRKLSNIEKKKTVNSAKKKKKKKRASTQGKGSKPSSEGGSDSTQGKGSKPSSEGSSDSTQGKGSKPSSEGSSDDEVMFISEKPATQKNLNNIVETSPTISVANQAHNRNIPCPQLSSPKPPWQQETGGVKKTPGQSLLDLCYVYELQPGGGVVPSPLVNNSLQPCLQTSPLSSRETSRYLETGPQGTISVVTPSKSYTTSVNNGRVKAGLQQTGNSNFSVSEVVTMVDGSIMSIERSELAKKRNNPSGKCNSGDVEEIHDDDVCEMTPTVTLDLDPILSDKAPDCINSNKKALSEDTNEVINATVPMVNDVISDSMPHEEEVTSVADETEVISDEGQPESAAHSSDDEVTVVSDASSHKNTSKEQCVIPADNEGVEEVVNEICGDEASLMSDAVDVSGGNQSSELSKERNPPNDKGAESLDVATGGKSSCESSGDEVTVLSSDSENAEEENESDKVKSITDTGSEESADVSAEKEKQASDVSNNVNDDEGTSGTTTSAETTRTSSAETEENGIGSVQLASVTQTQTIEVVETLGSSKANDNRESPDSTKEPSVNKSAKSNGKKSIQDIANKLKQQMEKKTATSSSVSSPTTTVSTTIESPSKRLHLFCSNKFKRVSVNNHFNNAANAQPIPTQKPGEVILIGDDSDEEEVEAVNNEAPSANHQPAASKQSVPKSKPMLTGNKPIATGKNQSPVLSKPSAAKSKPTLTSSKANAASKKPSHVVTKPPVSTAKVSSDKKVLSVASKKQPAGTNKMLENSAKVTPGSKILSQKKSTGQKKVSTSTVTKEVRYVSNILSEKASEKTKPSTSRILGPSGGEQTKPSTDSSKTTTANDDDDDDDFTSTPPQDSGVATGGGVTKLSKTEKIKKLETLLERLERRINSFARQELGFRDMESEHSAYMLEARAKERFLHYWRMYCKLIGEDADAVVSSRKKIKVNSSPFPRLNACVEKYINKSEIFPNLFEVKHCCIQANIKYNLDLKQTELHHHAVDIFTEIGRKLQKRRVKDFRNTSGNVLTDEVKLEDDPARKDGDLKLKLKLNKKVAKERTDHVFKDFVRQQYEQTAGDTERSNDSDSESQDDKVNDSDGESQVSDNENPQTGSDSDSQGTGDGAENSDSDDSDDSDNDVPLIQVRKEEAKRRLSSKGSEKQATKKKRVDKTVISLTLSSSQEIQETSGNNKIDYQVTIGSSKPKIIKSVNNNNENRSKSPSSSSLQLHKQSKGKSLLRLTKPPAKRQLSSEISTETPSSVKPKDNKIAKLSGSKTTSQTGTGKHKRISLANDNVAGNYAAFESPEGEDKSVRKLFEKPFQTKRKVRPTLLPAKPVVVVGTQKETVVPAQYVPLSMLSKMKEDDKSKGKDNVAKCNESIPKSKQQVETIVLDDDDD